MRLAGRLRMAAGAVSGDMPVPEFPIISRSKPVAASNDFGGVNAAANAVDADYGSTWRSVFSPNGGTAQWLAIDLRSVANADKANVWCVIKNPTSPTILPTGVLGSDAASPFIGVPRNYQLQGHVSTGASPPADGDAGWVVLATVTDNRRAHRIHTGLVLTGYGWFRLRVTAANGATGANDDVNVMIDLRNAAGGSEDSFLFFGDSISMEATRGRNVDNTAWAAGSGPIEGMLESTTGRPAPVILDASTGGWRADLAAPAASTYLDPFAGVNFVVIPYGANDANAAGADLTPSGGTASAYAQTYKSNMQSLIDHAVGLGMTVILPQIMYGNSLTWSDPNRQILNQIIDQLVAANPGTVIAGPDMHTFFAAHPELLRDGLHPTWDETNPAGMFGGLTGYGRWHQLYATYIAGLYA